MRNGAHRVVFTGILAGFAIVASEGTIGAAQEEHALLRVATVNHAGVPDDVWQRAQATASRIYEAAGIKVIWIGSTVAPDAPARPSDVTIIVSAAPLASRLPSSKDVLGYAVDAARRGRMAYAFYERIQQLAQKTSTDVGVVLGHVMAHETGHLLLAKQAHSLVGLMRGRWEAPQIAGLRSGLLAFTKDEAAVIRARVAEFSVPISARHELP